MTDLGGEVPGQQGGGPEGMPPMPGLDAAVGADAATAPVGQDGKEYRPSKMMMAPVIDIVSFALRGTRTFFEEGAKDEIRDHRDNGGSLLMLMTHFRRWETVLMAHVTRVNEPLQHVRFNTGIAARREFFSSPFPVGFIISHSGCQPVERSLEKPKNETPEQRAARKDRNQQSMGVIGRDFIAKSGGNGLVFGEGGTKEVEMKGGKIVYGPDGEPIKKDRKPGKVLPVQKGFAYILRSIPPEKRAKVKLLGIAVHYGDWETRIPGLPEKFAIPRPTIAIPRPEDPLPGDYTDDAHIERVRLQGENLLKRGTADAVMLDGERRRGRL